MDDNNITMLNEAQFEWAIRLVHILQPLVYEGIHTIFQESIQLCQNTDEEDKYLMTFQNFLARIPKWSNDTVEKEVARMVDKSGCTYLEDLITCVHITHLKMLTSIRTGKTQKKIDIAIPKLGAFVHKVYINTSRALYLNVFLFDKDIAPLMVQKNKSEFNKIIKTSILDAIRESIPIEQLLRSYLDESTDLMKEEVKEPPAPVAELPPPAKLSVRDTSSLSDSATKDFAITEIKTVDPLPEVPVEKPVAKVPTVDPIVELLERPSLKFSDVDQAISVENILETIDAPKDIARLEEISERRNTARKIEEAAEDAEDKLKIGEDANIDLGITVLS
jgi:hypothetical protein